VYLKFYIDDAAKTSSFKLALSVFPKVGTSEAEDPIEIAKNIITRHTKLWNDIGKAYTPLNRSFTSTQWTDKIEFSIGGEIQSQLKIGKQWIAIGILQNGNDNDNCNIAGHSRGNYRPQLIITYY